MTWNIVLSLLLGYCVVLSYLEAVRWQHNVRKLTQLCDELIFQLRQEAIARGIEDGIIEREEEPIHGEN